MFYAGFVYFEFDCWMRLKNPYLPLHVPNPMVDVQRTLHGDGRTDRQNIIAAATQEWEEGFKSGADLSSVSCPAMTRLVEVMCEDILSERRRIGGDWVVAGCVINRRLRDQIRRAK